MDSRFPHHPLLPPLLIAIVSLVGICLILAFAWIPRPSAAVPPTQTVTPFKYRLLATMTATSTAELETAVPTEILSFATMTTSPPPAYAHTGTTGTVVSFVHTPTPTFTPDPIFSEAKPMTAGKYDDSDSHLIVDSNWTRQQKVESAFQKSLLVSSTVGNRIAFRFTGYQMMLGYQSDANAGEITVNVDGQEVTVTQLIGNVWFSQELEPGTHFVTITHVTGKSINVDYIEIIE